MWYPINSSCLKLFLLFQNELIRIYFHWTYWLFFRWSAVKYIFYLTDATVVNYFRRLFSYLRIYTRCGRVEVCVREDRCVCLCVYVYCFVSLERMSNPWICLFWPKFLQLVALGGFGFEVSNGSHCRDSDSFLRCSFLGLFFISFSFTWLLGGVCRLVSEYVRKKWREGN